MSASTQKQTALERKLTRLVGQMAFELTSASSALCDASCSCEPLGDVPKNGYHKHQKDCIVHIQRAMYKRWDHLVRKAEALS